MPVCTVSALDSRASPIRSVRRPLIRRPCRPIGYPTVRAAFGVDGVFGGVRTLSLSTELCVLISGFVIRMRSGVDFSASLGDDWCSARAVPWTRFRFAPGYWPGVSLQLELPEVFELYPILTPIRHQLLWPRHPDSDTGPRSFPERNRSTDTLRHAPETLSVSIDKRAEPAAAARTGIRLPPTPMRSRRSAVFGFVAPSPACPSRPGTGRPHLHPTRRPPARPAQCSLLPPSRSQTVEPQGVRAPPPVLLRRGRGARLSKGGDSVLALAFTLLELFCHVAPLIRPLLGL